MFTFSNCIKTYLSRLLYETCIIFFLLRPFYSPYIRLPPVVLVVYQDAHKHLYLLSRTLLIQRALSQETLTITVQSLPRCHHWVACHFKTIFQVKLYWLKELFVPGELSSDHAESLTVMAKHPAIWRLSFEKNSTNWKNSVSQGTWTINMQSLPKWWVSFSRHLLGRTLLTVQSSVPDLNSNCPISLFPVSQLSGLPFQDVFWVLFYKLKELCVSGWPKQWLCSPFSSITNKWSFENYLLKELYPLEEICSRRPQQEYIEFHAQVSPMSILPFEDISWV